MADKKKAKSVADVALYRCTVNLEENFDLFCALVQLRIPYRTHSVLACFLHASQTFLVEFLDFVSQSTWHSSESEVRTGHWI